MTFLKNLLWISLAIISIVILGFQEEASAVSDYDAALRTTSSVVIGSNNFYGITNPESTMDLSSIINIMSTSDAWAYSSEYTTYQDLVATYDYYSISQYTQYQAYDTARNYKSININLCKEPQFEPYYQFTSVHQVRTIIAESDNCQTFEIMTRQILFGSGGDSPVVRAGARDMTVSTSIGQLYQDSDAMYYESNYYNISYPPDYEGPLLGGGGVIPPYVPDYNDKISMYYKVSNKTVTLINTTQQIDYNAMMCQWTLVGYDSNVVLDTITGCSETQEVEVPDNQLYVATLSILMDINGDSTILADESIAVVHKNLLVDGTSFEGGLGSNWADSPDWTDYTCDVLNIMGCVANLMHYAFGYDGENSSIATTPLYQMENNTHGLTAVITAPFEILGNLQQATYECNAVYLPLPFVTGSELRLPCLREEFYTPYLGTFFTLYETAISGVLCYYIMVKILEVVKNAKDPNKDMIEVLAL